MVKHDQRCCLLLAASIGHESELVDVKDGHDVEVDLLVLEERVKKAESLLLPTFEVLLFQGVDHLEDILPVEVMEAACLNFLLQEQVLK